MRGYELLQEVLALLRQKLPEVDVRECWEAESPGRLPKKPVITGQVGSETGTAGEWGARLDFTLYLPRGGLLESGEEIIAAMDSAVKEGFPSLTESGREGFGPDKATGLLAAACFFAFSGKGGSEGQSASIGGVARSVSGWEVSVSPGRALVAIGEEEPFAVVGGVTYTVALEGIDTKGLERLAGFTVELGGQVFLRCRWKSLDETGKKAVFLSNKRTEGGGQDGGA